MELNLNNVIAERKNKTIYRDGDKAIKLFVENYSKANILNEALNQARVEEGTDLKVPKLLAVTMIGNRWALVSEYIEGKTLEQLMNENPDRLDEYLNKFIDIQVSVLSNNVPMLSQNKEKCKERIDNANNIDYNIKFELLQRLNGMKTHTKLCHGDFIPSNIIITANNDIYIIDWAHVTQGNASSDIATTYLEFALSGKQDLADKYLNLFSEKSGIDKSYFQRWIPIVAAARKAKGHLEEQDFLAKWIDVVDFS